MDLTLNEDGLMQFLEVPEDDKLSPVSSLGSPKMTTPGTIPPHSTTTKIPTSARVKNSYDSYPIYSPASAVPSTPSPHPTKELPIATNRSRPATSPRRKSIWRNKNASENTPNSAMARLSGDKDERSTLITPKNVSFLSTPSSGVFTNSTNKNSSTKKTTPTAGVAVSSSSKKATRPPKEAFQAFKSAPEHQEFTKETTSFSNDYVENTPGADIYEDAIAKRTPGSGDFASSSSSVNSSTLLSDTAIAKTDHQAAVAPSYLSSCSDSNSSLTSESSSIRDRMMTRIKAKKSEIKSSATKSATTYESPDVYCLPPYYSTPSTNVQEDSDLVNPSTSRWTPGQATNSNSKATARRSGGKLRKTDKDKKLLLNPKATRSHDPEKLDSQTTPTDTSPYGSMPPMFPKLLPPASLSYDEDEDNNPSTQSVTVVGLAMASNPELHEDELARHANVSGRAMSLPALLRGRQSTTAPNMIQPKVLAAPLPTHMEYDGDESSEGNNIATSYSEHITTITDEEDARFPIQVQGSSSFNDESSWQDDGLISMYGGSPEAGSHRSTRRRRMLWVLLGAALLGAFVALVTILPKGSDKDGDVSASTSSNKASNDGSSGSGGSVASQSIPSLAPTLSPKSGGCFSTKPGLPLELGEAVQNAYVHHSTALDDASGLHRTCQGYPTDWVDDKVHYLPDSQQFYTLDQQGQSTTLQLCLDQGKEGVTSQPFFMVLSKPADGEFCKWEDLTCNTFGFASVADVQAGNLCATVILPASDQEVVIVAGAYVDDEAQVNEEGDDSLLSLAYTLTANSNNICDNSIPYDFAPTLSGTTLGTHGFEILMPPACDFTDSNVHGEWYHFVSNGDVVYLDTCSDPSLKSHRITIYTGSCGQLECVPGLDEASCGTGNSVVFPTESGQTYYIRVHAVDEQGPFQLSYRATERTPAFCPYADDIVVGTDQIYRHSWLYATTTPEDSWQPVFDRLHRGMPGDCGMLPTNGEPTSSSLGAGNPARWHTFIGNDEEVYINTCSGVTAFDTIISVYEGSCAELFCVEANDNVGLNQAAGFTCSETSSHVSFFAEQDKRYFVVVHGQNGATGDFGLKFGAEACLAIGTPVQETDSVLSGSIASASWWPATAEGDPLDVEIPACEGEQEESFAGGQIYSYYGTGGVMTATTCNVGTNFEARISVYTGRCSSLECSSYETMDNSCGDGRMVQWKSEAGQLYYVHVYGTASESETSDGNYDLDVSSSSGETCSSALGPIVPAVSAEEWFVWNHWAVEGWTVDSSSAQDNTIVECGPSGASEQPSVWYTLIGTGAVLEWYVDFLSQSESNQAGLVSVFQGSCGALECVTFDLDQGWVSWESVAGATYYIRVSSPNDQAGRFSTFAKQWNNACEFTSSPGWQSLPTDGTVVFGRTADWSESKFAPRSLSSAAISLALDTVPIGEIDGRNAWYSVVGKGTGLKVSACSRKAGESSLGVVILQKSNETDAACQDLSPVASSFSSPQKCSVTWSAEAGEKYLIFLRAYEETDRGRFGVSVAEVEMSS